MVDASLQFLYKLLDFNVSDSKSSDELSLIFSSANIFSKSSLEVSCKSSCKAFLYILY